MLKSGFASEWLIMDTWHTIAPLPFGHGVTMGGGPGSTFVVADRYIVLMGSAEENTYRVGKTANPYNTITTYWTG